jgi:hypothetical protein
MIAPGRRPGVHDFSHGLRRGLSSFAPSGFCHPIAMPDIDFFAFFRFWLATIVTIYATVITLQSFRSWYSWLAGDDKYSSLLRRYLLVHGLRLRFKAFWGDVLICGLLCIAFFIIWHAQILLNDANNTIKGVNEIRKSHVQRTVKHS